VLFNTHYHFDHVGSNELLGGKGVKIVAHENVKTRLSTTFDDPAMGRRMVALSSAGLPTETFASVGRMTFGQDSIEYTHTPPAHTDGDAYLFVSSSNVLHAGDLLWIGRYPVVDYTVGGSLAAMADALGALDRVGDANTRVIPGHGGAAGVSKTDMRQTREVWAAIDARLQDHAKQGHTVEEVIAAGPTKAFDERVGSTMSESFLRQAYGGILARS
jgi:glyoxylase-like metal-dependent hydrolase (beta-lactamase superfamily II)